MGLGKTVLRVKLLDLSFISAQYAVFLYRYIKEWRKNPHWSFSCCLALLVPLNDLQQEVRGFAGENVLKTQLQTGQIEKPSILSAVNDSGFVDVTLEGSGRGDDNKEKIQDEEHRDALDTRHQGTQTALCAVPLAYIVVHVPETKSDGERL